MWYKVHNKNCKRYHKCDTFCKKKQCKKYHICGTKYKRYAEKSITYVVQITTNKSAKDTTYVIQNAISIMQKVPDMWYKMQSKECKRYHISGTNYTL